MKLPKNLKLIKEIKSPQVDSEEARKVLEKKAKEFGKKLDELINKKVGK